MRSQWFFGTFFAEKFWDFAFGDSFVWADCGLSCSERGLSATDRSSFFEQEFFIKSLFASHKFLVFLRNYFVTDLLIEPISLRKRKFGAFFKLENLLCRMICLNNATRSKSIFPRESWCGSRATLSAQKRYPIITTPLNSSLWPWELSILQIIWLCYRVILLLIYQLFKILSHRWWHML